MAIFVWFVIMVKVRRCGIARCVASLKRREGLIYENDSWSF